jgi:hypothetical protein
MVVKTGKYPLPVLPKDFRQSTFLFLLRSRVSYDHLSAFTTGLSLLKDLRVHYKKNTTPDDNVAPCYGLYQDMFLL